MIFPLISHFWNSGNANFENIVKVIHVRTRPSILDLAGVYPLLYNLVTLNGNRGLHRWVLGSKYPTHLVLVQPPG